MHNYLYNVVLDALENFVGERRARSGSIYDVTILIRQQSLSIIGRLQGTAGHRSRTRMKGGRCLGGMALNSKDRIWFSHRQH